MAFILVAGRLGWRAGSAAYWNKGDNQLWTLEPASNGYVFIVARHSGKVLDVEYASTDDGARVIQYTTHGGANQQWLLRAVESTATSVTP